MKIKFTTGLPASGKSTWAKEYAKSNKDWVRVCRDDIRNMRGEYWIPKQEKIITDIENASIMIALSHGKNVIVDATNLDVARIASRMEMVKEVYPETTYTLKSFLHIDVKECIKRDFARANSVGEKVIMGMYNKHLAPVVEPVVYNEDRNLPHCVIVDVDGTVAEKGDRSPFDWKKVGQDTVRENVAQLVRDLYAMGKTIIIFTGRDGVCEDETRGWLSDHNIPFHQFFIRPEGDSRKDSIIKREIYEENIKGQFYIDFILDDRDQVVDMWRNELGINCLQVNYGNF